MPRVLGFPQISANRRLKISDAKVRSSPETPTKQKPSLVGGRGRTRATIGPRRSRRHRQAPGGGAARTKPPSGDKSGPATVRLRLAPLARASLSSALHIAPRLSTRSSSSDEAMSRHASVSSTATGRPDPLFRVWGRERRTAFIRKRGKADIQAVRELTSTLDVMYIDNSRSRQ